jgi:hypothetical protein
MTTYAFLVDDSDDMPVSSEDDADLDFDRRSPPCGETASADRGGRRMTPSRTMLSD